MSGLFEKYIVEQEIVGKGTYGSVRRCVSRETGEIFAVKTLKKSVERRNIRFQKEGEMMKSMTHKNTMGLKDYFENENFIHIVMELATGGELFDKIVQSVKFTEQESAKVMFQILSSLDFIHNELGIFHCDLKPENFLFVNNQDDSPLKLIDFGLSRSLNDTTPLKKKVGTLHYMAPEIITTTDYSYPSDMWSVGVILFILLSGYPPFHGKTDEQTTEFILRGNVKFPKSHWATISKEAKDLIMSLINPNVDERLTAKEALQHPWFDILIMERPFIMRERTISENLISEREVTDASNDALKHTSPRSSIFVRIRNMLF